MRAAITFQELDFNGNGHIQITTSLPYPFKIEEEKFGIPDEDAVGTRDFRQGGRTTVAYPSASPSPPTAPPPISRGVTTESYEPGASSDPTNAWDVGEFFPPSDYDGSKCADTEDSSCLQVFDLYINPNDGFDICSLDGKLSLYVIIECHDSALDPDATTGRINCPLYIVDGGADLDSELDDTRRSPAVIEITLDTEDFCAELELESDLTCVIRTYDDQGFPKSSFHHGQRATFVVTVTSTLPVYSNVVNEIKITNALATGPNGVIIYQDTDGVGGDDPVTLTIAGPGYADLDVIDAQDASRVEQTRNPPVGAAVDDDTAITYGAIFHITVLSGFTPDGIPHLFQVDVDETAVFSVTVTSTASYRPGDAPFDSIDGGDTPLPRTRRRLFQGTTETAAPDRDSARAQHQIFIAKEGSEGEEGDSAAIGAGSSSEGAPSFLKGTPAMVGGAAGFAMVAIVVVVVVAVRRSRKTGGDESDVLADVAAMKELAGMHKSNKRNPIYNMSDLSAGSSEFSGEFEDEGEAEGSSSFSGVEAHAESEADREAAAEM